jgi:hypothetical protein
VARTVRGDPVQLTNRFSIEVNGVLTDTNPTTVTLDITEPGGSVFSYTNGSLTNSTNGVWTKAITASTNGVWTYQWVGSGVAPDTQDGQFTVWPDGYDSIDVLTLVEMKQALDISQTDTTKDEKLANWITTVSEILDVNCGPIRTRADTNTIWTGGNCWVKTIAPIYSVSSITEYTGTTATTLTADTISASPAAGYRLAERPTGTGNYSGTITRTAAGVETAFAERVVVAATYGRHPSTEVVHPKFKQAAALIAKNLFRSDTISIGSVDDFELPAPTFPASYAVPNSVRDLLGDDWNGEKNRTMASVMFG